MSQEILDQSSESQLLTDPRAGISVNVLSPEHAEELGVLSDGRRVLKLQGNLPEAYAFYLAEPEETIEPVDTSAGIQSMNALLTPINISPVTHTPTMFAVVPTLKPKDQQDISESHSTVSFQFLHLDRIKSELMPYRGEELVVANTPPTDVIRLEENLYLTLIDGKEVIIGTGERQGLYSPHYRQANAEQPFRMAQIIAPGIAATREDGSGKTIPVIDPKWQKLYAKELSRRILAAGLPKYLQERARSLADISSTEILMASITLDDWQQQVLTKYPKAQDYWLEKFEEWNRKVKKPSQVKPEDYPPHMNITTPERAQEYIVVTKMANEQASLTNQIAKHRKSKLNGFGSMVDIPITANDLREVEKSVTKAEIELYFAEIEAAKIEQAEIRKRNARNFLSAFGVPHDILGFSHDAIAGMPQSQVILSVSDRIEIPQRGENTGMFTRALEHPIPDNVHDQWGTSLQVDVTRQELVDGIRSLVQIPLVDMSKLPQLTEKENSEVVAAYIWKNILKNPQVESLGKNKRTPEAEAQIVQKIAQKIKAGKPIDLLIFGPWGTAPSVLRSGGRQQPHFGHLDFMVRMHRLNTAVEQAYKPKSGDPAIKYHWVNESSAFANVLDTRTREQIDAFEAQMLDIAHTLSPNQKLFKMYAMADLMWGTQEERAMGTTELQQIYREFAENYSNYARALFEAFENGRLDPNSAEAQWVSEKRELIYPIATIIDPTPYVGVISPAKLAVAYEYIRATILHKKQSFYKKIAETSGELDPEIKQVALILKNESRELILQHYIPIMDYRYHTNDHVRPESAERFAQLDPWKPLYDAKVHTRITDGGTNRLWLRLNSGDSLIHPTHGVTVIRPSLNQSKPSSMSVRTWAEVAAEPKRYVPVTLKGEENDAPFHYIQLY